MSDVPDGPNGDAPADPQALLDAYLRAVYVRGDARGPLVIGGVFQPPPRAGRVHALLTACNPGSRLLPAAENARRMAALRQQLRERNIAFEPATAEAPDGAWHEESLWLDGVALATADELAREFRQNAFVCVDARGQVRLRVLREDWRPHAVDDPRIELAERDRS
jgi:hypothetical protein